ncbi:MAG: class A beta-lactamase-related serine hydrolase [Dehalococcoidia bacterium]|nr:class A beta-lactamase-related serine hydrolase [Dehalococcoidia bacterium]MSQ34379.1 class A beta-lactamase-related serine hydrolase [Dehalococcoidia bacterium]
MSSPSTGLDRLPAARDRLTQGMGDGLHTGAQLYVSLRGAPVCDGAVGEAAPGVPVRPDTVFRWLSAGKPVAAVAVAQLAAKGLVGYDRPVAEYVPEFEQNGKRAVTLRHVLTHTGGFRSAEPSATLPTWEERVAGTCAAHIEERWVPGERAGYHPNSGWVMLGEVVRRVTGVPFDVFARNHVFLPLGMEDSWAVATPDLPQRYGSRWGELHSMEGGQSAVHPAYSTHASLNVLRPGSTLRGPARDLGLFYEALLTGMNAFPVSEALGGPGRVASGALSPASATEITSRQRTGMLDETFNHVMDWGLGVIIDSKQYGPGVPYGFGQHASPRTFGHGGSQSSLGFADPEHGLVVAAIFNGLPGEARHDRRVKRVTAAIYEDLGLALS